MITFSYLKKLDIGGKDLHVKSVFKKILSKISQTRVLVILTDVTKFLVDYKLVTDQSSGTWSKWL